MVSSSVGQRNEESSRRPTGRGSAQIETSNAVMGDKGPDNEPLAAVGDCAILGELAGEEDAEDESNMGVTAIAREDNGNNK